MFVAIDADSCQGSGYCEEVAPTVFEVVDGTARIRAGWDGEPGIEELIEEAASLCPAGAIQL